MVEDFAFTLRLIRTCDKTPSKRSTTIWHRLKRERDTEIPRRKILRTRRAPLKSKRPTFKVPWLLLTIGPEPFVHLWADATIETANSIVPFRPIVRSALRLNPLSISRHS